jgi:hypothetical protein
MKRDACIDVLHKEVLKQALITRRAYAELIAGWDLDVVEIDGQHAGVVMMQGTEIHFCIDKGMALKHMRRILRNYVAAPLARLGYLTTKTLDDPQQIYFLQRVGFKKIGHDGGHIVMRLDKLSIQ